jgi:hypothetical protein
MSSRGLNPAQDRAAPQSIPELTVVSLPGLAPTCPLDRLDTEACLRILAEAGFESPRDRAAFYSRDAMRVNSSWGEGDFSFNQALLERFVAREAEKLGWKRTAAAPDLPHADIFYVTMHQLPEGIALARVTLPSVQNPSIVHFQGRDFRNDSYTSTAELIDEIAGCFSKRARGIVTLAVDDSEPDTFFRRIEHPNLMENPEVQQIRTLSARSRRDLEQIADRETLRDIEYVERLFDKSLWNQWQREQWLTATIDRLMPSLTSSTGERELQTHGQARARFFGEIYHLCNEIDRLGRFPDRTSADALIAPEISRLSRCAILMREYPNLARETIDQAFADPFSALTLKGAPGATIGRGGIVGFATRQLDALLERMAGDLERYAPGLPLQSDLPAR